MPSVDLAAVDAGTELAFSGTFFGLAELGVSENQEPEHKPENIPARSPEYHFPKNV